MNRFAAAALAFCLFLPASVAQTRLKTNQPLPYGDADGYKVLSTVIDARTEKLKTGSLLVFHQTVSEDAFKGIRAECASHVPAEFQDALKDFDKKAKTTFLLGQGFSIRKAYSFVDTTVGVRAGIYSVSAVGFDENKSHAIVLVQHLVRPAGDIRLGGDRTFYLLRRTETGWRQAEDAPKCGQIY